ncbi:MAG: hypothetical protein ACLGI9_17300 [Thermoanaerobaculia bacterium]
MHLLTAERLAKHFLERGGPGIFTKPFAQQPPLIRTRLTPLLGLKECESAAVAYFIHEYCWVVLTTQRLLWKEGVDGGDLGLDEIRTVRLDMYDFLKKGRTNMDTLYVVWKDEQSHRFRLESGPPFWGFYSALQLAVGNGGFHLFGAPGDDAMA